MSFTIQNLLSEEVITEQNRKYTFAIERTFNALNDVFAMHDMYEECGAKPPILLLMNSRGTGKTCTVIDAAQACDCVHLLITLWEFCGIVDVVSRCSSFFVHPGSDEFLALVDIEKGFERLYRRELVNLFASCRDAIQREPFAPGMRVVIPSPIACGGIPKDSDVEDAWKEFVESIPAGGRVVMHVDDCHYIFGGIDTTKYPTNEDLVADDPAHRFEVSEAPRLALRSFFYALEPFVSDLQRALAWIFSGTRTNTNMFLNIPASIRSVDLSKYQTGFDTAGVISVFSSYVGLDPAFVRKDPKVVEFFDNFTGPPSVIGRLFLALHRFGIDGLASMMSHRGKIIDYITEALGLSNPILLSSVDAIKFSCLTPALRPSSLRTDLRERYWRSLTASGLLKVDLNGSPRYGGHLGPRFLSDLDQLDFLIVHPYPLLHSAMCRRAKTPGKLVHELFCRIESTDDGQNRRGKLFEIAVLAALTSPRRLGAKNFLSFIGVSECLKESILVKPSMRIDFDVQGDEVSLSWDPSSLDCGADIVFEGTLKSDTGRLEKASVAIQATYNALKTDDDIEKNVRKMAAQAVNLYRARGRRSIIVFASAGRTPSEHLQARICRALDKAHSGFLKFDRNTPLPTNERISTNGRVALYRPYALFFAGPSSPIFEDLVISVNDICDDKKPEMQMAVLSRYAPELLESYDHTKDSSSGPTCRPREKMSSSARDFLAHVLATVGEQASPIPHAISHYGLTGLSCFVPAVLMLAPQLSWLTTADLDLLKSLSFTYGYSNRIRGPSKISLDADARDLLHSVREWGSSERDVTVMKTFLQTIALCDIRKLTFESLAGCNATLGAKLAVLAVVKSIQPD